MTDQANQMIAAAIEKIAALTRAGVEPTTIALRNDSPLPAVSLPSGRSVHSLAALFERIGPGPHRPTGNTALDAPEDFARWVDRFSIAERTLIFAEHQVGAVARFTAVLDHDAAPDGVDLMALPYSGNPAGFTAWRQWRGVVALDYDPAWKAWAAIEKAGWLSALDFAEAIEDRVADIGPPSWPASDGAIDPVADLADMLAMRVADRAEIVKLSRVFRVKVDAEVKSAQTLQSGEAAITFVEEHKGEAGERVNAPGLFALMCPVFEHGPIYRLPVRLRYRVGQGGVKWAIQRHRPDIAEREAFAMIAASIAAASGVPVLRGAPPAEAKPVSPAGQVTA